MKAVITTANNGQDFVTFWDSDGDFIGDGLGKAEITPCKSTFMIDISGPMCSVCIHVKELDDQRINPAVAKLYSKCPPIQDFPVQCPQQGE
jgi:hypothetical protein